MLSAFTPKQLPREALKFYTAAKGTKVMAPGVADPCNLRKCQRKDPEEEGPGFMSSFEEKAPSSVPKSRYKWPHHRILRAVGCDGLWLHNQISDQWKGETWRSQHTHKLKGKKKEK